MQLLGAVSFMHTVGVVHRHVVPDNVMLNREWKKSEPPRVVLVDFGSAAFARGERKDTLRDFPEGLKGAKLFAAPEMCRGDAYGAKSDVWSVGVLLMVLLTGLPPPDKETAVHEEMQRGTLPRMPPVLRNDALEIGRASCRERV